MLSGMCSVAWPAGFSARLSRWAGRGGVLLAVAKILGVGFGGGFVGC